MKRVVITGVGIWSCLGTDIETVKDSLYNGKSGIIFAPERKEMGFESGLTAFVKQPELKGLVDRAHRVFMPEEAQYAYMATVDALKMAKLDQDYLETHDVGLLYGNDSSNGSSSVPSILRGKWRLQSGTGSQRHPAYRLRRRQLVVRHW